MEFALFLPKTTFVRFTETLLYKNIAEPQVALFPENVQFSIILSSKVIFLTFERKQRAPPITGAVLLMKFEFNMLVFNALFHTLIPSSSVFKLIRTAPPDLTFSLSITLLFVKLHPIIFNSPLQ